MTGIKKKKKLVQRKIKGPKIWSLKKADTDFGKWVTERDGKCLHPHANSSDLNLRCRGALTCSHYFSRGNKSTRFDPDNCITLCWWHHFKSKDLGYEYHKQRKEVHGWDGLYTLWMQRWLGEERWAALCQRVKGTLTQKKAIIQWMNFRGEKTE